MCLITNLKECLIAQEDFVCYKELNIWENCYLTPCTGVECKLNSVFKPQESDYEYDHSHMDWIKLEIGKGYIHASFMRGDRYCSDNSVIVKCICRKGTEYYIDDDLSSICARELYITDEIVEDIPSFDYENYLKIFSPIINDVNDGISIGDYFLSDHTFVHAKDYNGQKKVIGVVGYINDDNEAIIVALNSKMAKAYTGEKEKLIKNDNNIDGRKNTKIIAESELYSDELYPSVAYVINYETEGTKKGDWYLPASDEVLNSIIMNMLAINISLLLLNDRENTKFINYDWHGTSTIYSAGNAAFYTLNLKQPYVHVYLNARYYIRPFFAYNISKD